MKFARFDGGRTALVVGNEADRVLDVGASLAVLRDHDAPASTAIASVLEPAGAQPWLQMIGRWDEVRPAFQSLVALAEGDRDVGLGLQPFAAAQLDAPLPAPGVHIFSFSSNTAVHIQRAFKAMKNLDLTEDDVLKPKRSGLPPGGFTIWPSSVVGHGATVTPPPGTHTLDYEGECAVILKRGGRNLETVDLWGHVAWNDFGIRDTHLGLTDEAPWAPFSLNLPKNFDTGNACGPWVAVDEGHDLRRLRCVLTVNGEVRQDWNLADMIYSFEEMFLHVSKWATVRPGDMVTSGTGAGVAIESGVDGPHWLRPGDVVQIELDGAGTLTNRIGAW